MKKGLFLFCILAMILLFPSGIMAATDWDPNMGGGGSGGGTGTAGNKWTPGWDGFRITFITNNSSRAAATISVDLTNYNFVGYNVRNFQSGGSGKYKFYYASGGNLSFSTNYKCFNTSSPLPNVIGSKGDIDAVVARFSDAGTIRGIVQKFIYPQNNHGFATWQDLYSHLADGTYSGSTFIPNYKILVEPIAYFYYDYDLYAMTAAEASRFQQVYGGLSEKMGSLTRYLLPTSMYLNSTDSRINLSAFPGMSSILSNSNYRFAVADILAYGVGCGIVAPLSSWNANVDLTSTASANKSTFTSGETVRVTATVTNIGTRAAPTSHTSLKERYGKWDGSDAIDVQRIATNSLAANGGNQTMTFTFTAPTVTSRKQYELAITADSYAVIAESNETNNISYVTITVDPTIPASLPDLIVSQFSSNKQAYASGQTATFTMTVKNQGGAYAVGHRNGFRDLGSIVPKYANESKLVTGISANASVTYTFNVTLPTVTKATEITFQATADTLDNVTESNENNNVETITITVYPSSAADLTILSIETNKDEYESLGAATVTMRYTNIGISDVTNGFYIRLMDTKDMYIYETYYHSGTLRVGEVKTVTFNISMPSFPYSQNIVLEGFIDSTEVIAEINESNNRITKSVRVNQVPADLTVTAFSTDKSIYSPGDTVTVYMTVKNQGFGYANSFYNRLYDLNAIPSKYVSTDVFRSRLVYNESISYTMTFTAPFVSSATMIYLRAFADATEVVVESDEANNIEDCTIIIMPTGADLDIDADDGEYYTDTTVITPAKVFSSLDVLPDDEGEVIFSFYDKDGELYEEIVLEDVICPGDESQLVWSKWKTPDTPQEMTLIVKWEAKGSNVEKEIPISIVDIIEVTPPDTTAKDIKPTGFHPVLPVEEGKDNNSWNVWEYEGGGFVEKTYTASLDCTLEISPHESAPTAVDDEMKSGYGIALAGTAEITSDAPESALAASGKGLAFFPEYEYDTYHRVLDIDQDAAAMTSDITFQINPLDHYKGKIHFTPLWYPDGSYSVYASYLAAYTPAGELVWHGSDDVRISGNLFDDWSVTPAKP